MNEWVLSHVSMSHVTHMNGSCLTYEWVMSHIWTSHVSHMNASCHTYEWVMSHISMRHVSHMRMPYLYMSFSSKEPYYQWLFCRKWSATWSILWVFATLYHWVMSHICACIRLRYTTHMDESCHTFERVKSQIWMSHVTHMDEARLTYEWVMAHLNTSFQNFWIWLNRLLACLVNSK
jgi:hypothetical protein